MRSLFLVLFILSSFQVIIACHEDEREALLAFKSDLADPSNRLSSWKGQNCCYWQGIHCSDSLHVVTVNLRNPNPDSVLISMNGKVVSSSKSSAITGIISSSLFNLAHIHTLDLSFNNFMFSKIPKGFSNLTRLTYLNLSNAGFSDSITTQFANLTSLETLDISCSFRVSNFPSISYNLTSSLKVNAGSLITYTNSSTLSSPSLEWLQGLVNLRTLVISGVDLSHASSKSIQWAKPISFLHNLAFLQLSNCRIVGEIPVDYLLNLTHLYSLQMDFNYLTSIIPEKLRYLTNLSILDLTKSGLQGPVPHLPRLIQLHVGSNRNLTIDLNKFFELPWPELLSLDISSTRVTGSIPSSFANASSLVIFMAYNCQIQGSIHSSIADLTSLQVLMLDLNNISGTLPPSFGNLKSLQYLSLIQNSLQGIVPESICGITSLEYLVLSSNSLTGHLPDCISQMPNLRYLDISNNVMMNGTVSFRSLARLKPDYIGLGFSGLKVKVDQNPLPLNFQPQILELSSCEIGGGIPDFISRLTRLEYLSLAHNNLSGEIPLWLLNLPSLGHLDLSFNKLQGVLPPNIQLHSFFASTTLNLAHNNLHGPIPLQLQNIESIDLSENSFTGSIPTETDLGSTLYFSLSGNNLSGQIPPSFCPAVNVLRLLDLSDNILSGPVPTSLGNCTSLVYLGLGWNYLSGKIPHELGKARSLSYLALCDNQFEGTFPSFVQKLPNLMVLKIGYNRLEGNIPRFIGDLQNLHILVLEFNSFNGSIPQEIYKLEKLQFLGLSNNKLSGPISNGIEGLKMLKARPEDGNILGYVVSTIYAGVELRMRSKGSLHSLEVVRTYHSGMDLSCNSFTGNIPSEIGLLHGLSMLNISHNALSGEIPDSIGRMSGLESLDLSFNNLSGSIPATLNLLDALSTVDFSYNNFSGKIPSGTRFDTWYGDGSPYVGNEFLCDVPGGTTCNISGSTVQGTVDTEDADEAKETLLFFVFVIFGYVAGFWGGFMVLYLIKEKQRNRYWKAIDKIALRILQICNLK